MESWQTTSAVELLGPAMDEALVGRGRRESDAASPNHRRAVTLCGEESRSDRMRMIKEAPPPVVSPPPVSGVIAHCPSTSLLRRRGFLIPPEGLLLPEV